MKYALGMIETKGLVSAVEASDAMVKTADVHLIGYELATGGYCCIKIMGEVAAVKSAAEAAANRASRIGELISVHVIPRPDMEIDSLAQDTTKSGSYQESESPSQLEKLSVKQLRKIARATDGIGIKGREISKANKEKLIEEIKKVS
jgi:ethanolamine utilization protein EutM